MVRSELDEERGDDAETKDEDCNVVVTAALDDNGNNSVQSRGEATLIPMQS